MNPIYQIKSGKHGFKPLCEEQDKKACSINVANMNIEGENLQQFLTN